MIQRSIRFSFALILLGISAAGSASAQYHYGGARRGGGSYGEQGVYFILEGMTQNVRNADAVVATTESSQDFGGGVNVLSSVLPDWDDEFTGRLSVGYRWAGGSKLSGSFWAFESTQSASGNGPVGGFLHFAIGPPIRTGGGFVGNVASPGFYDASTEISANTADIAWAKTQEVSDRFAVEWSLGLRYVTFEETTTGVYDEAASNDIAFGAVRYDALKSNEGTMIGARAGIRGSYRVLSNFSASAGLAFSVLDGELEASSTLSPSGTVNSATVPTAAVALSDDGRSGHTLDFDVQLAWHSSSDMFKVWLGWEQSRWEEIAADLVRNFPGTTAPLRDRDAVTFSGYKVGIRFGF